MLWISGGGVCGRTPTSQKVQNELFAEIKFEYALAVVVVDFNYVQLECAMPSQHRHKRDASVHQHRREPMQISAQDMEERYR